jgi:hypothetical protein
MAFACGTCWKTWSTWRSRNQHVADTSHEVPDFECGTCDRYFKSQPAVEQHMSDLDHWAASASDSSEELSYYCEFDYCGEEFETLDDLRNHEINDHFYCDPSDRSFKDLNSIKMVSYEPPICR